MNPELQHRNATSGLAVAERNQRLWSYLRAFGSSCLAYSTLQEGLHHIELPGVGYCACSVYRHRVFSRRGLRIVVGPPVCSPCDYVTFIEHLKSDPQPTIFLQVDQAFAAVAARLGLAVNELGVETELDLPSFTLAGKLRGQLRHWINKARKEQVEVFESPMSQLDSAEVDRISEEWLRRKGGRELRLLARPFVPHDERDVRYFWARQRSRLIGFIVFDPVYRAGTVEGYYHNHIRIASDAPHGTSDLITIMAIETFQTEGIRRLLLGLSPLIDVDGSTFPGNACTTWLLRTMRKYGASLYPFEGNWFHKRKYGGNHVKSFFAGTSGNGVLRVVAVMRAIGVI